MGNIRHLRNIYIGTRGRGPTQRNLNDGDTAMILAAAAQCDPPIPPTRLIEEIVACWCADRRCGHLGTSETTPLMAGEREEGEDGL